MTTMHSRLPTKLKLTTEALIRAVEAKKPSKYRNTPVVHDGIRFASKAEGKRYLELKLLERAGKVAQLELQKRIALYVNGVKVCTYVADFDYFDVDGKKPVVEDVKGMLTPEFKLKAKLFRATHGYDITIIKA
jgi:hypothetical protein